MQLSLICLTKSESFLKISLAPTITSTTYRKKHKHHVIGNMNNLLFKRVRRYGEVNKDLTASCNCIEKKKMLEDFIHAYYLFMNQW